jgi:autotransporter-associated beta strand protein
VIVNGGATFQFTGTGTTSLNTNRGVVIGPTSGAGDATFDITSPIGQLTVSGIIANNGGGSGRLVKIGPGTLQLNTSTNTYTGGVSILAGTLGISSDARLGAVPAAATPGYLVVNDGATLRFTGTTTTTVNANRGIAIGPPSGTGSAMFETTDPANMTLAGIITNNGTGTGRLVKTGTGTLTLTTSTNTFSGGVSVLAGVLSFASDVRLGAVPAAPTPGHIVVADGATFRSTGSSVTVSANRGFAIGPATGSGTATFDANGAAANLLRISGIITDIAAGSGGINKVGVGILRLDGVNTFTGGVVVNDGTLRLQNARAAGTGPGGVGNTLITLQNTAVALEPMTSSTGTVNYTSDVAVAVDAMFLSGRNSIDATVTTTQSFGNLTIGANAVTVGAGTNVAGQNANFGFRFGGTTTLTGTPTFTVNNNGTGIGTFTLNGAVSGGFGLTKAGPGVMVLNAANTYTGPTTITAGTLSLTATGSIAGSSAYIVGTSAPTTATLDASAAGGLTVAAGKTLGGSGSVVGPILLGGTVAPGNSIGTLSVAGMTWQPGGTYQLEYNPNTSGTPGTTNDFINGSLALDLSGLTPASQFNLSLVPAVAFPPAPTLQTYVIATFAGGMGMADNTVVSPLFNFQGGFATTPVATIINAGGTAQSLQVQFTPAPVPEPGSILLTCAAAAGLAAWRRNRKVA